MIRRGTPRIKRRWAAAAFVGLLALFLFQGRGYLQVVHHTAGGAVYRASLGRGTVGLERTNPSFWPSNNRSNWRWHWDHYRYALANPWRPYHTAEAPWPKPSRTHGLVAPLWPIPLTALGWLLYTHGLVRGQRLQGRCARCGYDLTGLDTGVCPECGSLNPAGGKLAAENVAT